MYKFIRWAATMNELRVPPPEPVQGVDYYTSELRSYTVSIEVMVGGLAEDVSDVDMQSKAVEGFRDGSLDGDAQVVHSEKIRDIELDFKTDLPFDRKNWLQETMAAQGLRINGDPLRPGEKARPDCETTLENVTDRSILARINDWCRRCRNAFSEAF